LPSAKGIVSREFLGEDTKGNFYFLTGRPEYKYKLYDGDEFDAGGNYVGSTQIPSSPAFFPSVREFALSSNGNIYSFTSEENQLVLHIFLNQDK
jgi:hypothetical protein